MTKDEALKLALEALTVLLDEWTPARQAQLKGMEAVTAIKQAIAAPVQEPVGEVCGYYERGFDAEKTRYGKLYNQDLPLGIKLYTTPPAQPAPVQEPVVIPDCGEAGHAEGACGNRECLPSFRRNTTPPAAQRQWVGLTDEELKDIELGCHKTLFGKVEAMQKVEAKLKEKNAAAQPAVPDAIHHTDLSESLEYIQGWNECRQAMLEMMK
jgi:hypothetical protein